MDLFCTNSMYINRHARIYRLLQKNRNIHLSFTVHLRDNIKITIKIIQTLDWQTSPKDVLPSDVICVRGALGRSGTDIGVPIGH